MKLFGKTSSQIKRLRESGAGKIKQSSPPLIVLYTHWSVVGTQHTMTDVKIELQDFRLYQPPNFETCPTICQLLLICLYNSGLLLRSTHSRLYIFRFRINSTNIHTNNLFCQRNSMKILLHIKNWLFRTKAIIRKE